MKTLRILIVLTLLLSGCRITTVIQGKGLVASPNGTFFCSETGGNCTEQYTNPTTETLFAGPAPGYTFASWAGCSYVSLTSCATSISQGAIDANYQWTVTAKFKPVNPPVQAAAYTYNALGQRITKRVGGVTTIFQYDMDGKLIAELNASGQPLRQHIHVNGEPIAQVSTNTANGTFAVQYVHTDHLGTPTLLTDQGKAIVADIEATPFGETYVDYATVVHNQRFPGQYKDEETGLHYNYHRDYDPTLGRYVQSDPLGVTGRTNNPQLNMQGIYGEGWFRYNGKWYFDGQRRLNHNYGYASQNPNRFVDLLGLNPLVPGLRLPSGQGLAHAGNQLTQPTGNFLPGFQQQDDLCSVPGVGCLMDQIPDLLERCINHDQCYADNACNATSWGGNLFGADKACNQCNSNF